MSSYSIAVLPAARRDIKSLDQSTLRIVDAAILGLGTNPRPFGCKKLVETDAYRIRVSTAHGPYRVLYFVDDAARAVTIARVVPRRDAY